MKEKVTYLGKTFRKIEQADVVDLANDNERLRQRVSELELELQRAKKTIFGLRLTGMRNSGSQAGYSGVEGLRATSAPEELSGPLVARSGGASYLLLWLALALISATSTALGITVTLWVASWF